MIKTLKLLISSKNPNHNWNVASGFSSFSTKTLLSSSDNLFKRILPAGDPKVSIVPILDQWVQEGRPLNQSELKSAVKLLRNCKRYTHALQLAEWMKDSSNLSPADIAIRLDLISRVRGLREAEKYFNDVSDTSKTYKVYGSLLNCYASYKLVDKAEEIMQIMRQSGCNMELSYNIMLNLYSKLRKCEKLEKLVQEMEKDGLSCGKSTYYILLNASAADSDIEAMEKLFKKMEMDPVVNVNWHAYVIAAKGYSKAGLRDKASDMLKKAKNLIRRSDTGPAYHFLLSMYASLGNKDEVNEIWHLYKKRGLRRNMGYFYMINSLIRLDDINGAEKIFQEWEAINTSYDFRILNTLINAYTKKGLLREAEALVNKAVECEKKVPASTWDHLSTGYYKDNQMEKAAYAMKNAVFSCKGTSWTLNCITLKACLEYMKVKGDVEREKIVRLLAEQGIILENVTRLHETGSCEFSIFDELEKNDEEIDSLLLGSKSEVMTDNNHSNEMYGLNNS
ncbi:hypothetical protein ACH5RR_028786 [Cinchona calisaya]|uniref:Pentatricopeptide repeat-containing protein n=1 Tax=Cinchona calisaya TaxID=153742 RepID=A0ABD2YTE4_9GENT